MTKAQGPNAEQITYWSEVSGPKWVRLGDDIDAQIAPLGNEAMEHAAIREGARILDVGCGCGYTSIELARRAGPSGEVMGIDISGPMLDAARARAKAEGFENLSFIEADAQTHSLAPESYDLIFSRFGVMFFADPRAAFQNLRSALAPQGKLVFLCWQGLPVNQWMLVPMGAAAPHIAIQRPTNPDGPGPFSLADADKIRSILSDAGFAEIEIKSLERKVDLSGGTKGLDETADFVIEMGPLGSAMREAEPATRKAVTQAVRESLVPYQTGDAIRLGAGAWIVSARSAG